MTYPLAGQWRPTKNTILIKHFDDRAEFGTTTTVVLWRDGEDVVATVHCATYHRDWPHPGPLPEGPGYTYFRAPGWDRIRQYVDQAIAESGEPVAVYGFPVNRPGRHWSWNYETTPKEV